jgi:hypothetical protein
MAINTPKIEYGTTPTVIEFDYPPSDDFRNTNIMANSSEAVSNNGKIQVQYNFTENNASLSFTFISEELKLKLDAFFLNHALKGNSFKYFEDKTLPTFKTVTLDKRTYAPEILFPSNVPNEYVYAFKMTYREIL